MSAENNGYSVIPVQGVMLPLRILQLIFGLGVLGISAYHLSLVVPYGITYDVRSYLWLNCKRNGCLI
jgi:hypothetical protein